MRKIVIFSAAFPPEPIVSAKISYDLAEELSRNNTVTVVCPNPSRPLGFEFVRKFKNLPFVIEVIDSYTCPKSWLLGRIWESISFGLKCKEFIKSNYIEIDVIYMNAWPIFAQYLILSAAKKYQIKVIAHVQDIYPESYTNKLPSPFKQFFYELLLPIDKFILKNAFHILAISEKMKDYLMRTRIVQSNKISVVTNWHDENEFLNFQKKSKKITNTGNLTFMYLGNIGPVAGVEFLVESFAESKLSNAKLVVAGAGSMKEYCKNLSLKYTESIIEFIDVPDGKVPEIQNQADVMLLPVKKGAAMSSIPSKLPAYMFSKKPIIACVDADSDTADSIQKSGGGWVIEPENKYQLIALFKAINEDEQESRVAKGVNGFNFAMENFSKRTNLQKIVSIIETSISINSKL